MIFQILAIPTIKQETQIRLSCYDYIKLPTRDFTANSDYFQLFFCIFTVSSGNVQLFFLFLQLIQVIFNYFFIFSANSGDKDLYSMLQEYMIENEALRYLVMFYHYSFKKL